MHAKDERIDVRDLGFAATLLPRPRREASVERRQLRLGGMALATGCSSTGRRPGPPPCAPRRVDQGRLRAQAPAAGRRRRDAARPARRRPPRRGASSSSRSSSAPARGQARLRGPGAWRSPPGPLAGECAGAPPRARLGASGASRPRRWCPRCSRCAVATWRQYHGVEHKAIAAYEQGDDDARDAAKEHDRCGSHLLAPLLAANLAGAALLRRAVERPGKAAQLGVQLAAAGAAVEVFAWSERHARHPDGPRPAAARPRAPARRGHARAHRGPARRRAGRARRGAARRARRLSSGPWLPMLGAWPSRA